MTDAQIKSELTKRLEQFGFKYKEFEPQDNGSGVMVVVCIAEPLQELHPDGSKRQCFGHGYTHQDAQGRMIARYALFQACSNAYKIFG